MAYTKQNFENGNVLEAEQLNHIEDGIASAVLSVNGMRGDVHLTAEEVGALPKGTPIPNNTSELNNDSGFVTKLVRDLTNYYLKEDTYNKTEIDNKISSIPKFSVSVVTSLPSKGEASVIYLVGGGVSGNMYTEYIWTNNAWEILGSQNVDLKGYATETWVSGQLASYLKESELASAINTALAQAAASGQFDGVGVESVSVTRSPDENGFYYITLTLTDGQQQVIPYKDGKDGDPGAPGQRGFSLLNITTAPTSYTTAVNGITPAYRVSLSTVKSQSKATEVITGDTIRYSYYVYPVVYVDASYVYLGTRVSIRGSTGAAGAAGADGYTPVRGTDYWTPDDQESIVQQVITALGTPVFGTVDDDKNIILSGELASGTYTVKYEDAEGNIIYIGSLNAVSGRFDVPLTWDDGHLINADMGAKDVGKVKASDGYTVTEHIALEDGYAYTVSAKNWNGGSCYALWFNANGGLIASGQIANGDGWGTSATGDVSFLINPPVGTATFKLQSFCNGNYSAVRNVVVEATLDNTKKYGGMFITWQPGVKLNKSNGTVEATGHASYSASDFIQLDKTKTYTLHLAIASGANMSSGIVYYTSSGSFVSCIVDVVHGQNDLFSYTLSIPTDATQMRLRPYDSTGSYDWLDQLYLTVSD